MLDCLIHTRPFIHLLGLSLLSPVHSLFQMAAAAAAAARSPIYDAPWEDVVAYIDGAMPRDPSWKQIEAEVDARTQPDVDDAIAKLPWARSDPVHLTILAKERWRHHMSKLYPRVYNVLRSTLAGDDHIGKYGVVAWAVLRWFPADVGIWVEYLSREWNAMDTYPRLPTAYTLQRLSVAQAQAIIRHLADPANRHLMHDMARSSMLRFRQDVGDLAMRDRTDLALSGVIDRVALRQGAPLAQYLARFIAPDAITVAHPLRIREHASQLEEMRANMSDADHPDAVLARVTRATAGRAGGLASPTTTTTNQQYLESIMAVMRAPGQDPAATLARARDMLDTLMQSIDDAAPPPLLPSFSSSSSPSSSPSPPATYW